jgi:hypothetical protein
MKCWIQFKIGTYFQKIEDRCYNVRSQIWK